jgi:hypothetical protein
VQLQLHVVSRGLMFKRNEAELRSCVSLRYHVWNPVARVKCCTRTTHLALDQQREFTTSVQSECPGYTGGSALESARVRNGPTGIPKSGHVKLFSSENAAPARPSDMMESQRQKKSVRGALAPRVLAIARGEITD